MRSHEHAIAAPATALVRSAISVIRCSGRDSISLVSRLVRPEGRLEGAASHTMHHVRLVSLSGEVVDEVMVAILHAPATYTGEESVEIFGHGSPAGVRRILEALYEVGFHPAAPGEFTRRAFLNGKIDLTRAEAIDGLVRAQTLDAHRLAIARLSGDVQEAVAVVRSDLVGLMAQLAVQLDYPEEDSGEAALDRALLVSAAERTATLAKSYEHGRLRQEGVSVALAGRTNAGKSSLFNALLRQDRSIVSEVPGTTRDYLEATVDIGGVPVRLFDTAGLRPAGHQAAEPVEAEGIRRSRAVMSAADLVIYVVDASDGFAAEDSARMTEIASRTPVLAVWNKTDLTKRAGPENSVPVSAITGAGLDQLNNAVLAAVGAEDGPSGTGGDSVVIDSVRQHHLLIATGEALERTTESLDAGLPADVLAVDLQDALNSLGEITGEVTTDEILDEMFSSFCLGK